jgi:hypothetical protein
MRQRAQRFGLLPEFLARVADCTVIARGAGCKAPPATAGLAKALFGATSSVKGNADEDEHDGKHDDSSESFHGYNFPI